MLALNVLPITCLFTYCYNETLSCFRLPCVGFQLRIPPYLQLEQALSILEMCFVK